MDGGLYDKVFKEKTAFNSGGLLRYCGYMRFLFVIFAFALRGLGYYGVVFCGSL